MRQLFVVALSVLLLALSVSGCNDDPKVSALSSPTAPTPTVTVTETTTPPPVTPTSTPRPTASKTHFGQVKVPSMKGHKVVATKSGTGTASAFKFGVPAPWRLTWAYECPEPFGITVQKFGYGHYYPIISTSSAAHNRWSNDVDSPYGVELNGVQRLKVDINDQCRWTIQAVVKS